MAIVGAHTLIYTPEAEALRATIRDVLGWHHVDAGDGWLIFALPPAELGVHPSDGTTQHQLSLICDEIGSTVDELRGKGITFAGEPSDLGFGIGTRMQLPGGVEVLLYEPRRPTAI